MIDSITDLQIIQRLAENRVPCAILDLQNGVRIIISQAGARIYGPFLQPGAASMYWTPVAFADADACRNLLATGWNLGGERLWIAPEIQYLTRDRSDHPGSVFIPPALDPGHWSLDQAGPHRWRLQQDVTLEAFNLAAGRKQLHMETLINPVADPLRHLSNYAALIENVTYAGYQQTVTLAEAASDDIASATWNLIQVRAGGEVFVPAAPGAEVTNYTHPVATGLLASRANYVRVMFTGRDQFKVGFKAAQVTGRFAYLNHLDDGRSYLLVRGFFSQPSSEYPEEPAGTPGRRGDAIHLYNDDGGLGGFGELECQGRTIGGTTGLSNSTDQFVLWLYVGPGPRLLGIARHLLGIEI